MITKRWLIGSILLLSLALAALFMTSLYFRPSAHAESGEVHKVEPVVEDAPSEVRVPEPKLERFSIDEASSLWVIANKQRPLPYDYRPTALAVPNIALRGSASSESMHVSQKIVPDLEAMDEAMSGQGLRLALVSGFRSAQTQKQVYGNYVARSGQAEADRFSAKPGTSEHQTGLAFDVGVASGEAELEQSFGDTAEGKWLAGHAHEYGFIIRYPQGKEGIVGYMYEPWHLRYVGKQLASTLFGEQKTMEEYFGL